MTVISIFSASHCDGDEVTTQVATKTGFQIIHAADYIGLSNRHKFVHELLGYMDRGPGELIKRIDKNRLLNITWTEAILAEILQQDNIIIYGMISLLLPRSIAHILRACLIGDLDYRASRAAASGHLSEKDAKTTMKKEDRIIGEWAHAALGFDPWDEKNHDVFIPMNYTTAEKAANLISECAQNEIVKTTTASRVAAENFLMASRVKAVLVSRKHDVDVAADCGHIVITLKKYSIGLEKHKIEMRNIASAVEEVKSVEFKIGPDFKMPSTWPPMDFEVPKKVLLVDDEREFVQTLSERLQRRKIESTIAYDGQEALDLAGKDQPEVMVLDLKMPGIDGIEVLHRIKKDHPDTEVIILTGHGSDRERQLAAELGAFAYLEKPVDIDVLSETMKKAYAKVALAKQAKGDSPQDDR